MSRAARAVRRKYLDKMSLDLQFGIGTNNGVHFPAVEKFLTEVFIPDAMRYGTPAVYAELVATDKYMPDIERRLADLRPIGGYRALCSLDWVENMPATEDKFHSPENRAAEATCFGNLRATARYDAAWFAARSLFRYHCDTHHAEMRTYNGRFVHSGMLVEWLGLPKWAEPFLVHGTTATIDGRVIFHSKTRDYSVHSQTEWEIADAALSEAGVSGAQVVKVTCEHLPWFV